MTNELEKLKATIQQSNSESDASRVDSRVVQKQITSLELDLSEKSLLLNRLDGYQITIETTPKEVYYQKLLTEPNTPENAAFCLCCFGAIHPYRIEQLRQDIHNRILSDPTIPRLLLPGTEDIMAYNIKFEFHLPSFLDISRISIRTFITNTPEKIVNFTTFDLILDRILQNELEQHSTKSSNSMNSMKLQFQEQYIYKIMEISLFIQYQIELVGIYNSNFIVKKPKRKFGTMMSSSSDLEENNNNNNVDEDMTHPYYNISRSNIGKLPLFVIVSVCSCFTNFLPLKQ